MTFSRQNSFEYIVEKYQELIKKVDEILKEQSVYQEDVSSLQGMYKTFQGQFKDLIENVNKQFGETHNRLFYVNQIADCHNKPINDLNIICNDLKKRLEETSKNVFHISDLIVEIKNDEKSFAKNDCLQSLKDDHEIVLKEYKKCLEDNRDSISSISAHLDASVKFHEEHSQKIALLSDLLAEHSNKLIDLSDDVSKFKESMSNAIISLQISFKEYVDNKIKSIPEPEIPSLEDMKVQTDKQLEPVILDSRNSNTRSVNNEMKISILEKKVEQLQLLLKQFELQK